MKKNIIVLMTALVPTTGHADLIRFAASIPDAFVHVLINGRTFEPVSSLDRWLDLNKHFKGYFNVEIQHSVVNDAPQNPEDLPDNFWFWWRDEINRNFPYVNKEWDYVVASEPYGAQVARSLDAEFIPYDIERTLNPARGQEVRSDLAGHWNEILPETRQRLHFKATLFGQESVGKTTISKLVKDELKCEWLPEYARHYLETVGSEVTLSKMRSIHFGQYAYQKAAFEKAVTPFLVLDTDLFSTVGYYRIMKTEENIDACIKDAKSLASDIYYLLPDDIPLEKDPLRYGGDKRESDLNFWADMLESYRLPYVKVPSGSASEKAQWITEDMKKRFAEATASIATFDRE